MSIAKWNDNELIVSYIGGNQACLKELINRYQSKIFSYILFTVKEKNLAEDIFQDTFFKIINTLRSGSYKDEGKFVYWAMRIAHNLIMDYFRKSSRLSKVEYGDGNDVFEYLDMREENIEDKMILEQIHTDVRCLIELLPEDQKEVLMLRHYSDLSFKEIAEQTNVSINTALGRMRYAIINLRKLVESKEVILTA